MSATTTDPRRNRSLSRRLLVRMTAGFALLLLLISILLWNYSRAAANRTYDLLLAGAALSVLERVSYNAAGPTVDLPQSAMDILALAEGDRVVYRVFSPRHGELTGTPALPLPQGARASVDPLFFDAPLDEEFRFVWQGRRITSAGGREWVFVQIGQTMGARNAQRDALFLYGMAGLGGVSLIGLLFVRLAIGAALSPLRDVAEALQAREASDFSPIKGAPPREISVLFDAINRFIAQLGRSRALTETFIADVAHQTRTALSALEGQLSLAADAQSHELMRDRVGRAEAQAGRAVHLTNQLLANAMVIHRSDEGRLAPLDLRDLVRDTLAELLRERRLRAVTLSLEDDGLPGGKAPIQGDAISIREALRNLIDNAVRHGGPRNTIRIELAGDDRNVRLAVSDAGPGIAPRDRARATERFTSINRETAGSGLGLAIVRAVAEGHGGRLELGSSPLGGLRASLMFPRLAALLLVCLCALAPPRPAAAEDLVIWASTDRVAMEPIISAFEAGAPGLKVRFRELQTVDLHRALMQAGPGGAPDLAISSAMDLQVDLVNRGLARRLDIPEAIQPPAWAQWRDELFGFTFEPAAILYDRRVLSGAALPTSHRDLSSFIRDHEDALRGKVGGYDLRRSGIGYLFATQDTIQSVQAQRLAEVLGRAGMRSYCCTSRMVEATARGELVMAFNVIGSYALHLSALHDAVGVHFLDDYNLVMSRTAFVPAGARNPKAAEAFVAFLLSPEGQRVIEEETALIPLAPSAHPATETGRMLALNTGRFLPIRLGPGLLTFLDRIKRREFLRSWDATRVGDVAP